MEQLKELKDYGLKFKQVKEAATLLNDAELSKIPTKVGVSGQDLLTEFVKAIKGIPDAKLDEIPEPVANFYESIPEEVFKALPDSEVVVEEPAGEITSDCPTFMQGYDPAEEDCQECEKDFPEEHEACKTEVLGKVKKKKAKKTKAKESKETVGKRSRYGHMKTTMAARIDDLVYQGGMRDDIIETIMDEFKRDKKKATNKVNGHITHLINNVGLEIKDKDGKVKAKKAYAEGRNKDNTISTLE